MAYKKILFKAEAREKILRGVDTLTNAVRVTLGPKSKCVLIQRKWNKPLVCNDGVTIAKEIELEDPEENLGAQMIREAAEKTGDAVGDGTSTSTILAQEIFSEGLHNIAAGASAIDIKKGLDRGLHLVVETIRKMSRPVESKSEKAQVATVAAHNDASAGEMIANAMEKVGKEGTVSIEEAKGTETVLEVVEGMQFDRGYISPYFVTEPEKMEAILDSPYILIADRKITSMEDMVPLLEEIMKTAGSLLVIAEDVDSAALATLVLNKVRGVLHCAAVKAPGFGDRRKQSLEDIAVLTGGHVISEEIGMKLDTVALADLGRANRVVIDSENTLIIGGLGEKPAIEIHKNEIRSLIEKAKSDYDRDKLKERLAKLSGGVAVIHVGAPSEAELKNRKEALEDAINATKAAIAEGLVPGGGLSLLRAIPVLEQEEQKCFGDERTGLQILKRALEAPTRQIAQNSGADGGVVVDRMMNGTGAFGFDASKNVYVDLNKAGIVDPTKVVRVALENAVSVSGILLLAEATLTEVPEKESVPQHESSMNAGM